MNSCFLYDLIKSEIANLTSEMNKTASFFQITISSNNQYHQKNEYEYIP